MRRRALLSRWVVGRSASQKQFGCFVLARIPAGIARDLVNTGRLIVARHSGALAKAS